MDTQVGGGGTAAKTGSFWYSGWIDPYLYECTGQTYDPAMDHSRVRFVFDGRPALSRSLDGDVTETGPMPNSDGYLPNGDLVGFDLMMIAVAKRLGGI